MGDAQDIRLAVRVAANAPDFTAFGQLWWEYLLERYENGGWQMPSGEAMDMAEELFNAATQHRNGVCVVAEDQDRSRVAGVLLWAPIFPAPVRGGKAVVGQGTYIKLEYRRRGLAQRMYRVAMDELAPAGITCLLGSVDAGNETGEAHAKTKKTNVVQVVHMMEFY